MEEDKLSFLKSLREFYFKNYRKLLIIPLVLLVLAVVQISAQAIITGEFVHRGTSLKGGVTITVPLETEFDVPSIEAALRSEFPKQDITVRSITRAGGLAGLVVESDFDVEDETSLNRTIITLNKQLGTQVEDFSVEGIGSSLGSSFFREIAIALLLAFVFMGIVVFITFRRLVPSLAVILSAFFDITVTLAIANVLGIKLGTAGVAAFLMLIGYSVDTDILLATRVVKRKEGTVVERVLGAMKTGLTMTSTTMAAIIVALIVTQSEVIGQIMTILLIGLLVDVISTWIQNVGILRWYLERRQRV